MINRLSIRETTGDDNSVAQVFKHNIFFDTSSYLQSPFEFEVPQYTTVGGTKEYYDQNPLAIFTNLVSPFIRFDFSANTSSFGADTYIKHDIYRIDWETYNTVQSGLMADSDESLQSENRTVETIEEIDEVTGEISKKTIIRDKNEVSRSIKSSKNAGSREMSRTGGVIIKPTMKDLQDLLDVPVLSVTATTTGITTSIYDFQIDQYVKNLGNFKTELFQDRDQYIIDTNIIFNRTVTTGLKDYQVVESDGTISAATYQSTIVQQTNSDKQTVVNSEFAGLEFAGGEYFSYFQVPDKPIFEYPTPTGQIETFTPEIFWTNGENSDEYLVQVNYNTGDTAFTGTVFSYIVPKSDEFKEESVGQTKGPDTEFSTTKAIRKYQLSLKSNKCLIYRVGNVKVLKNIFGVRQSVVTFSENRSICTQANPIRTYVYTESDSPHTSALSKYETPPSLDSESPLAEYTLSGTVRGSIVSGATMQLVYPNASFVTTPTDSVGGFDFADLEVGTYTLNTTYRGYAADSRAIVISADTDVLVEVQILWDNTYDLVATKESDIIKY